ncbi:Plasmodium exported protein, unknown function [Plasmodium vivax]|uniref:Variable surface protein n=1 Tax=Plasmodium vivax TaxID=5855 RepID=A0A565A5L7_PLAVI|nr:Plasmodium exported protein, unknown function [Plasmodium vivax]
MINFHIFIKIITYISLTWMYICNNDVFCFIKILEKERQQYGTINMRHFRLLAIKNGIPKELEYASCGNAFSYEKYKKLKTKKEDSSTYKRLKREGLNDMEIYKKSFQCKYNKKKGLAKLDGYCEKKIFDKIDNMCEIAKMMNDEKKRYKKVFKKYGLPFVLSGLFVLIAGIFNVLAACGVKCFFSATKKEDELFYTVYSILLIILPIIIFLVLSYIAIKIKKYDRLLKGKVEGKMIAKEISCYYDDVFNST